MLKPLLNKIAEAVFVLDLHLSKLILTYLYRCKMRSYTPGSDDPDVFACLGGFDIFNMFVQPKHIYIITQSFSDLKTKCEIGFFFIDHKGNPISFTFKLYLTLGGVCHLYMKSTNLLKLNEGCGDSTVFTTELDTKSIKLFEMLTGTVISF